MIGVEKLWQEYKTHGRERDRDKLIIHYSPMVEIIANKMSAGLPNSVETDDLVGYGMFGLIDAVTKFDPDLGYKFGTYATFRVKGAIVDGLRGDDWVPRSVRERARENDQVIARVESIDSESRSGSSLSLADSILDASLGFDHSFDDMCEPVIFGLRQLGDRERIVLVSYYYENLTLSDIGRILGVTESRVCQIHSKAILSLREQLM